MTDASRSRVSRAAHLLGYAGLLPQAIALLFVAIARWRDDDFAWADGAGSAVALGTAYPLLILSFLGGIWWGFAMRRHAGQGALAALAVTPSLAALALLGLLAATGHIGLTLVAIGSTIMLTLLIDRRLTRREEVPDGWMQLRIPLSLGLGSATILLGILVGGPVTHY